MPSTFKAVVAGLAGDGGVREGGLAYRGKGKWRSLDSEWYRDPDERGGTRIGLMGKGGERVGRGLIRYPYMAIEKSTSDSGL